MSQIKQPQMQATKANSKQRTKGMVLMPSAVPRKCGGHVSASTPLAVLPYAATAAQAISSSSS
jgi:hypothetical protein